MYVTLSEFAFAAVITEADFGALLIPFITGQGDSTTFHVCEIQVEGNSRQIANFAKA